MNNFLKNSALRASSTMGIILSFIPESLFGYYKIFPNLCKDVNITLNRILTFIIVFIFYALYLKIRKKTSIKGRNYTIEIKYGDLFKMKNCKKVITFDECFTTTIGESPSDIKAGSICGQYLSQNPTLNIQDLINCAQLKPSPTNSKFKNKKRYESGKLIPNGEFLLMAFAKLDKDGKGEFSSRNEYLDCLSVFWKEIDKYYAQQDICIPILGAGITRIGDVEPTQQELLDMIILSYKLHTRKIKLPYKLHIVCRKCNHFSLNKIGESI